MKYQDEDNAIGMMLLTISGVKELHDTHSYLFPEFDLLTDPEIEAKEEPEKSDAKRMKEYEELMSKSGKESELFAEATESDLEEMAKEEKIDDIVFANFRKRIGRDPEQVDKSKC